MLANGKTLRLPSWFVWGLVGICALPALLHLIGVDFGVANAPLDAVGADSIATDELTDVLHSRLAGSFTHTILEWSSFCTAIFTMFLAFAHYRVVREIVTPIIGVTLFFAGCMDAFHTLAADRLISAIADNRSLIPFTWALCRGFNALILAMGVTFLLVRKPHEHAGDPRYVAVISLACGTFAYALIDYCATSQSLPTMMFPGSPLKRPYDIAPLAIFLLSAPLLYKLHQRERSLFTSALLVALIPNVATQLYMAFGSSALFDSHFNIAHGLKVLAYVVPLAGLSIDYTETHRAEAESSASIRSFLSAMPDGILVVEEDGTIALANERAHELFGYAPGELEDGQSVDLLVPKPIRGHHAGHRRAYVEATPRVRPMGIEQELAGVRKDGSEFPLEISLSPHVTHGTTSVVAAIRDVSARKEAEREKTNLENQLRQGQKMNAIGVLAGGIAHDFNNLLAAIIGYTELALSKAGSDERLTNNLKHVLDAGYHATNLVKQILAFSRQNEATVGPVQMPKVVGNALELVESSLPSMIEVSTDIDADAGTVIADETEIHQIAMNLCTNAYQAIGDTRGTLTIKLEAVDVDARLADGRLHVPPGRYVRLAVSDTGCGMDEETKQSVFDPFFTTKPVGEGTGMGLSVVHGIVIKYGGAIDLRSTPGEGTLVAVYLPQGTVDDAAAATAEPELVLEGSERVLLVDDEQRLVDMAGQMLEQLGYNVTGVASSVEALELFRQQPESFDVVITDQAMPQVTGVELAKELTRIRADIPIIVATGYSTVVTAKNAEEFGLRGYIVKPYLLHTLGQAVRKALSPELAA